MDRATSACSLTLHPTFNNSIFSDEPEGISPRVIRSSVFLAVVLTSTGASSLASCQQSRPAREVENLRAFAKLYGYVRFFHPSDEASAIDWDRFAIDGVTWVKNAASSEELKESLEDLFAPVAPTVQVYPTREPPEPVRLMPEDTAGLKVIAWQHFGVGLGGQGSIYNSKRLNRVGEASGSGFGTITQGLAAEEYRGKRIKLRAFVRAEVAGAGNQGQM